MLRRKGCVRVENGLCWVISTRKKTRGLFFPVLTPTLWKLMLMQGGKSIITYILENGFQERKFETITL